MLDFYLIKDDVKDSDHGISELDYLGAIDYSEFQQLQNEKVIEDQHDYFKDFRWVNEQVTAKINQLEQIKAEGYKLIDILRKAKEQNCGVIAFAD